jgi:hypothetical protein
MIVRHDADGGLTLILQTEHSQFVGQLAAHWGSDRFAPLQPYESVVRAATFHDYGYLQWEPDVPFNAETGEPYEFRQLPTTERQLKAYAWCIDWLRGIDPYSGLLVSMHRTGLWQERYGTITQPPARMGRTLTPDIQAMKEEQEAWQREEQRHVDREQLWVNYRLLQVWDLLGLHFGCQEPGDGAIAPVPLDYAGGEAPLTMKALGGGRIAFDPYPFNQHPLKVQIACKRLPQAKFPDQAAFRTAYFQAPNELLEYELL